MGHIQQFWIVYFLFAHNHNVGRTLAFSTKKKESFIKNIYNILFVLVFNLYNIIP